MQKSLKILLIEDNLALANQVTEFLQGLGWQVDFSATGRLGLQLACQHNFDVVLLDLNLPDTDGLQLCQQLLASVDIKPPILMLTARDAYQDKARGFATGADDYLTKPFDLRELALRCEALARRRQLFQQQRLEIGQLMICRRQRHAWWQGQPIPLTATAFALLQKLMEDHPYPSSRRDLIDHVWPTAAPETDALKAHIYTLRKSLDPIAGRPLIHTISSIGYKLQGLTDE